jgi:peroxiredoxin
VEIHQPATDFELPDLQGSLHQLSDYCGKIVLLNFWSAECPHSERADRQLVDLLEKWNGEVILLSIAANRNEPIQTLAEAAKARRVPTVLLDSEHRVADAYGAVTTPHVFVIDRDGILRYRGAVDDVTFRQRTATRYFAREAVEALLEGRRPTPDDTPAYGCAIVREI